jgi:putative ABC transport system permease protein
MTNPVGEMITWEGDYPGTVHGKVIGVVGDFNFRSLHDEIAPLIIQRVSDNGQMQYLLIRLTGKDLPGTIRYIGKTWTKFESALGFKYSFLDDDFAALYDAEEKMASIFRIFTLLGIFIACLGMIGLSSFMAEQRTKEIGVRKVHGSARGQIFGMLVREVLVQVLVASLLAWPVTWILLHRWLQNYAYHATVNPVYFLLATLTGALIAILVTGYQGFRAASRNPVDALRYE